MATQPRSRAEAMELVYLDESQNASFDEDYHEPAELAVKLKRLDAITNGQEFTVLDVGGGNGHFLDALLEHFPLAHGTLFDISQQLLALNKPHPRKTLVTGSVDAIDQHFAPRSFDIITMNWLLHHLVASSYGACAENCRSALRKCQSLLKPNGTIVITENMFDGLAGTNMPSWVIYRITRVQAEWFIKLARRYFNTAGVGVCFRSGSSWERVFRSAGLSIAHADHGFVWPLGVKRRLLFPLLAIKGVAHRHFYLSA